MQERLSASAMRGPSTKAGTEGDAAGKSPVASLPDLETRDAPNRHICILDASGVILAVNGSSRECGTGHLPLTRSMNVGVDYFAACESMASENAAGARETLRGLRAVMRGELPKFVLTYPGPAPGNEKWFRLRAVLIPQSDPVRCVLTHQSMTRRQQAQPETLASEPFCRTVVEDQTEVISRFKADGTFTFVNEAYCRFFGKTGDELIGQRWQPRAVVEDVPLIETKLRAISPANPVVMIENRVHAASGEVRWMQFVNRAFFDPNGLLLETQSVGRDITERKRAEEALCRLNETLELRVAERSDRLREIESISKKQHIELEQVYRTAPVGLCQMDRDLRYVRINDRLAAINGKPAAEHIGRTVAEVIPEIAPRVQSVMQQVLTVGRPVLNVEFHGTVAGSAGMERVWLASYYPLVAGGSEVHGLSVVVVDVTELKQTAAALKRTRDTLAEAQKIAHLGCFEYVVATRETVWSEEQYRIYGLDPAGPSPGYEELLAKWILPEDADFVNATFLRALQNRSVYELEHRIVRPDGTVRWTYDRAHPHFDAKGEMVRVVGTTLDITEHKRSEEALRLLTAQMEDIREQERQRLGRELHDGLSQTLTAMKFKVGLFKRQLERQMPVNAAEVEALETGINQTMDQVRDMARGLNPANLVARGLAAALEELARTAARSFHRDCSFAGPSPVAIRDQATALHIYRIAQEAIHNAIQHGQARCIAIRLTECNECGRLEVQDDGVGFSPDAAQSGMGLGNMQARAESIGGRLEIRSRSGGGTVIACTWPANTRDSSPSNRLL